MSRVCRLIGDTREGPGPWVLCRLPPTDLSLHPAACASRSEPIQCLKVANRLCSPWDTFLQVAHLPRFQSLKLLNSFWPLLFFWKSWNLLFTDGSPFLPVLVNLCPSPIPRLYSHFGKGLSGNQSQWSARHVQPKQHINFWPMTVPPLTSVPSKDCKQLHKSSQD